MALPSDHILGAIDGADVGDSLVEAIQIALREVASLPEALQRAAALWVWKRRWQAEHPTARRGGDRKSAAFRDGTKVQSSDFDGLVSQATGLKASTIFADVKLAEDLGPGAIRSLWTSPIADNGAALKAVAKLDPRARGALFSIWNDNPKLSFGAALIAAKLRAKEDTEEAAFQRLLDAWTRGNSKARRRFLAEIGIPTTAAETAVVKARKAGSE